MSVLVRRLENNLITLGTGFAVFSIWTFIKFALSFFLLGEEYTEGYSIEGRNLFIAAYWGFCTLDSLLRCYIGLSARAQGRGRQKRSVYLFAAGAVGLFNTLIIIAEIGSALTSLDSFLSLLISVIIDITAQVFLVELIVSAVRLKHARIAPAAAEGGTHER